MKLEEITLMQCWCCGKLKMGRAPELGSGWFKCANCEATWVKMPELAPYSLGSTWEDTAGEKHYHSRRVRKGKKAKK